MAEKCILCAGCLFAGKQVPGISHCGSCKESYCKSHLDQHAKRGLTSLHKVITIESDGLAELEEQPHIHTFCGVHVSEEIKGFCDACNIIICGACVFGLHKEHKYRSLEEVGAEKKTELKEILVVLIGQQDSLVEAITKVGQCEKINADSIISAILRVQDLVRGVHAEVDAFEAMIVQQLKKKSAHKGKEQLGGQKLTLDFSNCDVDNVKIAVLKALACDDIPSFLVMYGDITPRYKALKASQSSWHLQPCTNGAVHFEPAAMQAINLGCVVDGDLSAADFKIEFKIEETGAGKQCTITIVALSATGHDFAVQLFEVQLQPPTGAGQALVVRDMGKGCYSTACNLTESGVYIISVTLRKEHVVGSPLRRAADLVRLQHVIAPHCTPALVWLPIHISHPFLSFACMGMSDIILCQPLTTC